MWIFRSSFLRERFSETRSVSGHDFSRAEKPEEKGVLTPEGRQLEFGDQF
jgi:hypothetical protein